MSAHSVILYVHIVAKLLLSIALAIETLMLRHLRRAPSLAVARAWIDSVPGLRLIASGSLAGLMLSGVYLTVRMSAWKLT